MTLRDIAAADRSANNADPMGVAEDVVYYPAGGNSSTIRGVFLSGNSDARDTHGIGVEARFGSATLMIALVDAPSLTRADRFKRVATGVTWEVEYIDLTAGVGWKVYLKQATESLARSLRG